MTVPLAPGSTAETQTSESVTRDATATASTMPIAAPLAALAGWLLVAIVDLAMMTVRRSGTAPLYRIAESYALQLGNAVVAGAVSALFVMSFITVRDTLIRPRSKIVRRLVDIVAVLIATFGFAWGFLRHDFDSFAAHKGPEWHVKTWMVRSGCVLALTFAFTGGYAIARWLSVSWRRVLVVLVAAAVSGANYFFLIGDYYNVHFSAAWLAAILCGTALAGIQVPVRWRFAGTLSVSLLMVAAAAALVVPPPPGVVSRMLATRTDPFTMLLIARGYHGREGKAVIPPEQAAWFTSRRDLPPIPSTSSLESADRAIVLMLTIDCFRGDKYADEKNAHFFPTLEKMKTEGAYFPHAYSPGSQTVYTMTSWFTGKYFSQQLWKFRHRGDLLNWPSEDPTVRFPTLLDEAGVQTTYVMAGNWLTPANGLMGGFDSVVNLQKGQKYNEYGRANRVAQVVIDRLENESSGPLYVFAHFLDAHWPYKEIKSGGGTVNQYLRELTVIDTQIARIRRRVDELGLTDRTTIIISADHGESLGDHGLNQHGVSVFEELIHVPLTIVGPGIKPREIDAQVTTMDLGPTILDIFGQATPGSMMGESLVGVLRGEEPHFTRPIVSENRLRQTMVFPDGIKVSRDLHFGDGDAFDLNTDPRELNNRIDDPTLDTKNRFALLKAFFNAHTLRFKNYKPPYRR